MRNNILILLLLTLFFAGCSVQTKNLTTKQFNDVKKAHEKKFYEQTRPEISNELKIFIKKVVRSLVKKDLQTINKELINPKVGFYNLTKVEGIPSFSHQDVIYNVIESHTEELSQLMSYISKNAVNYVIIEQNLKFNCSPNNDAFYGWNGEGLYLSDKSDGYLSKMLEESTITKDNKYKEDIKIANFIETQSYKVILTPDIVFYVNNIDGKWYITLFDRITTDCSSPDIKLDN